MHQHLHIWMRFVELLDAVAEMIDQFPAFLGVECLEIWGDKDQCHGAVGAEQMPVDEGEAHAAGDVGHQALAQSKRVGGDQLRDHAGFVVHDQLVIACHGLVSVGDGGIESGVQGRVHKRRHVHHGVIERVERHIGLQTVKRVGDALVVGEDGVHQLINVADHHFRLRTRHLHEELVLDFHIAEHQITF